MDEAEVLGCEEGVRGGGVGGVDADLLARGLVGCKVKGGRYWTDLQAGEET